MKHHQWLTLSRHHAEQIMRTRNGYRLDLAPFKPRSGHEDEYAYLSAVLGFLDALDGAKAWSVPDINDGNVFRLHSDPQGGRGIGQGVCHTYVHWGSQNPDMYSKGRKASRKHPFMFTAISMPLLLKLRRSPALFARKFHENCTILKHHTILSDGVISLLDPSHAASRSQ